MTTYLNVLRPKTILSKIALLLITSLLLLGLSKTPEEEKSLVSTNAIIPTLLSYLMKQSITIKVPHHLEKDFVIVFDQLPNLKPEDKRLIDKLKLEKASLKNIEIKVKLDDLSPMSSDERGKSQVQKHFILNDKNDLQCKIKSFRVKADVKITRKGKNIFGKTPPSIRATIDKFELKDIESFFSFYLAKGENGYYAEELVLKHMVLSPKATIKIREFPPIVSKILSNMIGPVIADVGNRDILNDKFYSQFNENLPPRIPESGFLRLPAILQDIQDILN